MSSTRTTAKPGKACVEPTQLHLGRRKSWEELAALIRESYGLIAAKTSLAQLR